MQSQNEEKESLQKKTRRNSSDVNGNNKGNNITRTITDISDFSTSNVLYYNTVNDDDDEEESRRGIMSENQMTQESNGHSHNHSHSQSSNETEELKEQLKNQIDYWKKILNFGNTFVVVMTTIIIALYFTTDLFPEPINDSNNNNTNATSTSKLIFMTNQCLNETIMETNDMDSFLTCAGLCSDASSCCDIDRSNAEKQNRITTETAIGSTEAAAASSSSSLKSKSTVSVTNTEKDATTTTTTTSSSSSSCNDDKDILPISICENICTPILNDYLEYFITYMQTICDQDLIKNTDKSSSSSSQNQHRQLCQDKCSQLDCCFSMDDDINCLDKEELLCSSFYESCVVVHENAAMFGAGIGPQIITNKDD